jgi:predicted DNA-binding transcriptional regulator YafY
MRADRLVAILLLMQARGRVTAAEVADELEVSVATARRDLEALSTAGIPVYPQPGRGGGWSLLGGARTDLSGLTATEAQALFLLVGPTGSVLPEAKSALRKLVRALPETFRADAEAAARAVVIDPTRWGDRVRERPALVEVLQTAVVRRHKVQLVYANRARERTERLVDPWGLVDKDDVWYLMAGTEDGQRTFRVDRIIDASVTDLTAERPGDFELLAAWEQVVAEVEQRRSLVSATVLIDAKLLPVLRTQFGRQCDAGSPGGDGRVRARLAAPTATMIAQRLAGWGALVEVVESAAVQAELARIGSELTDRYPTKTATQPVSYRVERGPAGQEAGHDRPHRLPDVRQPQADGPAQQRAVVLLARLLPQLPRHRPAGIAVVSRYRHDHLPGLRPLLRAGRPAGLLLRGVPGRRLPSTSRRRPAARRRPQSTAPPADHRLRLKGPQGGP